MLDISFYEANFLLTVFLTVYHVNMRIWKLCRKEAYHSTTIRDMSMAAAPTFGAFFKPKIIEPPTEHKNPTIIPSTLPPL